MLMNMPTKCLRIFIILICLLCLPLIAGAEELQETSVSDNTADGVEAPTKSTQEGESNKEKGRMGITPLPVI